MVGEHGSAVEKRMEFLVDADAAADDDRIRSSAGRVRDGMPDHLDAEQLAFRGSAAPAESGAGSAQRPR